MTLSCSAPPSDSSDIPPVQSSSEPRLFNGTASPPEQDFVVYVRVDLDDGVETCSGVLVAPNLVVTAHHCVAETLGEYDCKPGVGGEWSVPWDVSAFSIRKNAHYASAYDAKVVEVVVPDESDTCGRDMAALIFDRPVGDLPVATLRETPPVAGEGLTAVGFGMVDDNGNLPWQRLQQTGAQVVFVGPGHVDTDGGAPDPERPDAGSGTSVTVGNFLTSVLGCGGDSGGPVLDTSGNVLGLLSRSEAGKCSGGLSIYTEVAFNVNFIHSSQAKAQKALLPKPDAGAKDAGLPDASDGGSTSTETPNSNADARCSVSSTGGGAGGAGNMASALGVFTLAAIARVFRRKREAPAIRNP